MTSLAFDPFVLKRVPLLSLIPDERLTMLFPAVQRRSFTRRAMIVEAGEDATGMYVLITGRAKVLLENEQGDQVTLAVIGPFEFFGEMSLLDERPRSACVEAIEACEALYIPKAAFLRAIDGNFAVAMHMLHAAIGRLRLADQKIERLGLMEVYDRVATVFLESAREIDGKLTVEIGSEEIARIVAASREMVSRVVKHMRNEGLVRKEKRKTIIVDAAAMRGRLGQRCGEAAAARAH